MARVELKELGEHELMNELRDARAKSMGEWPVEIADEHFFEASKVSQKAACYLEGDPASPVALLEWLPLRLLMQRTPEAAGPLYRAVSTLHPDLDRQAGGFIYLRYLEVREDLRHNTGLVPLIFHAISARALAKGYTHAIWTTLSTMERLNRLYGKFATRLPGSMTWPGTSGEWSMHHADLETIRGATGRLARSLNDNHQREGAMIGGGGG